MSQPEAEKLSQNGGEEKRNIENASHQLSDGIFSEAKEAEKAADSLVNKAKELSESVIVSAEETFRSVAGDVSEFSHDLAAKARDVSQEVTEKAVEASENYTDKISEELKDPAVSTTVLFTAVTASAASTYLAQQHKQGKLTALITAGVVIGVAALSAAEYFSVKAYFKRNKTS